MRIPPASGSWIPPISPQALKSSKPLWTALATAAGLFLLLVSSKQHIARAATAAAMSWGTAAGVSYSVPRDLKRALARSEELFQTNLEKRKHFIAEHDGLENMFMFSKQPWGRVQHYTVWDVYVPAYSCPFELERVGRFADGGKYTCGLPHIASKRGKDLVLMSFGVERESSFEAEVLERTRGQAYLYDFSVADVGPQLQSAAADVQRRTHFKAYGLGASDEIIEGHQFHTLGTLMHQNGHQRIDILKVDIEGAEAKVLMHILDDWEGRDLPFDQLLIEIHGNADFGGGAYHFAAFNAWWERLEKAGLRCIANELNYAAVHWNEYPWAIEMTFVNVCRDGSGRCSQLLTM